MKRTDERRGFLVSATVHLAIMMVVASDVRSTRAPVPELTKTPPPPKVAVFLPSAKVLRDLVPRVPPPPAPRPAAPVPTPPPTGKDRISIGPPSTLRQKDLILRRDEEVTNQAPKGDPRAPRPVSPPPTLAPAPAAAPAETRAADAAPAGTQGRPGLTVPPGIGREPVTSGHPGDLSRAINESLERRLASAATMGLPNGSGTAQRMGPLMFDPEGADFTAWINRLRSEVYRNWITPQPALMGFRGHVDLEFTVLRNGTVVDLHLVKSAGNPALDRAALNALAASQLMPLPSDYRPERVTMQATFYYNESPQG